jgi:TrwC relaxase
VINVGTLHDPDYHLQEVTHDSVAYYMREGEAPGRWAGSGAAAMGLAREVTSRPIHDLFDGKHPNTGEYLIPSKGSNCRARERRGEQAVDVKAAAAQLAIRPDRVRDLLSRGKLAGTKRADGHWEVPQPALDAYRRGAPQPCGGPAISSRQPTARCRSPRRRRWRA